LDKIISFNMKKKVKFFFFLKILGMIPSNSNVIPQSCLNRIWFYIVRCPTPRSRFPSSPTTGSRLMIGSCFINRQIMGSNMPTEWHCYSLERNDILFIRNEKKLLHDLVWTPAAFHRRTMQMPHNAPHSHPHNSWGAV